MRVEHQLSGAQLLRDIPCCHQDVQQVWAAVLLCQMGRVGVPNLALGARLRAHDAREGSAGSARRIRTSDAVVEELTGNALKLLQQFVREFLEVTGDVVTTR